MSVLFEAPRASVSSPPEGPGRPRTGPANIQDSFLFGCLKEGRLVAVALLSGQLIQGRIQRFDRYTVLVDEGGREILLYKQAISCIARASGR